MHRTGKNSQHSSIIEKRRTVWPNGSVFVYELSGYKFESHCCHVNFIEQGVPGH